MSRSFRHLLTTAPILLFAILALGTTMTMVAAAGPYDTEIASLRSDITDQRAKISGSLEHIAELEDRLANLDGEVANTEILIGEDDRELEMLPVQIELTADRFMDVLASREAPSALHSTMAVDAYVSNDERMNDVLTQSAQLTSTALEGVRHRMIYDSVIREAQRRIELVDAEMRLTAKEVAVLRSLVTEATIRRNDSQQARSDLIDSQPAVYAEIAATRSAITGVETIIRQFETEILAFERMAITRRWTGTQGTDTGRPALAVKIDNVTRAHPQAGLNQADVVYEELVEGGVTRLVAVFQSTSAAIVGPVRSARTSDLPLLGGFDRPLFAYSGANRGTRNQLRASPLVDAGYDTHEEDYWRDRERRAPHNLFTGTERLWAHYANRTDVPPAPFKYRYPGQPLHPSAERASGVSVDFGLTEVDYTWNGEGWARTHGDLAHSDADGVRVAPANVVIQFIQYGRSLADLRSPEAVTVGTGEAWLFTEGNIIQGKWDRTDASLPATFTVNGEEIRLSPGKTWVALAKKDTAEWRN
ncbi:MAG: DUF3048 domain-containing protein [Acidimicrobiales bacterium]|nr:DUF3048 domain-containing protein [Acidimicrobiales bacterium]